MQLLIKLKENEKLPSLSAASSVSSGRCSHRMFPLSQKVLDGPGLAQPMAPRTELQTESMGTRPWLLADVQSGGFSSIRTESLCDRDGTAHGG